MILVRVCYFIFISLCVAEAYHLIVFCLCVLMIRRPPRSTLDRSSAASDVYKRQGPDRLAKRIAAGVAHGPQTEREPVLRLRLKLIAHGVAPGRPAERDDTRCLSRPAGGGALRCCLLYTSDAADERSSVDLGGRRIIKKKKSTDNCSRREINQLKIKEE